MGNGGNTLHLHQDHHNQFSSIPLRLYYLILSHDSVTQSILIKTFQMKGLKKNYVVQVREWKKMGYDKDLWIFIYHQWVPMAEGHCEAPSVKSKSQNRGFRTWISGPGFQALNVGFQDLDIRTWVSGPRKLSILRSSYLFPVTFLCVHRHFYLRPVVTPLLTTQTPTTRARSLSLSLSRFCRVFENQQNQKESPGSRQFEVDIWFFFKTRLRTTEISTLIPTVTD